MHLLKVDGLKILSIQKVFWDCSSRGSFQNFLLDIFKNWNL